jgi:hypothetical protein
LARHFAKTDLLDDRQKRGAAPGRREAGHEIQRLLDAFMTLRHTAAAQVSHVQ